MAYSIQKIIEGFSPASKPYEELYKDLHANAELSGQEFKTAQKVEIKLREISEDLEIKSRIGGTGLIAILRNGPGKTVLLRADMDGLPVKETSGVEYACKSQMLDFKNELQHVMHACGHDVHIVTLLAATEALVASREHWSGTVVSLFQPAEERATGANDMVEAGLYTTHRCPIPDVVLGGHVFWHRAGTVSSRPGLILCAVDGMIIKVFGRGGHGSTPQLTVDPIVLASSIVIKLQTIISRMVPPGEFAVLTVGSLHAGTAENIICDEAILKVSLRTVSTKWRQVVLEAIERIVRAECTAAQSPKEPIFEPTVSAPLTENDAAVASEVGKNFTTQFGDRYNGNMDVIPASEDFSNLARAIDRPYLFWFYGGHDPADWSRREREGTLGGIPVNHSPFFAPVIQPTLKTGTEAMLVAALTYLQ